MLFSVIVPFLNEEKLIRRCLDSLLEQEFEKHEVELIFVDNGSWDRSADIVRQYPVTLLHEPLKDPYLARNRGIRSARGRFIAFTDSDCIVDRRWLAELYNSFKNTEADIVLGRLRFPSPTPTSLECHEEYDHLKLTDICKRNRRKYCFGRAGNMAVRASVFSRVGLFSGMPIVGDTEVIHKLLEKVPDARIIYEPRAEVIHAEVTRLLHFLYKQFECGQYSETYRTVSAYRPLRIKDNVRLAKRCLTTYSYDTRKTLIFGSTLAASFAFYAAGRLLRHVKPAKGSPCVATEFEAITQHSKPLPKQQK